MAKALPLYEGMRVNVDHVDPGQRRVCGTASAWSRT